jgi:hypothetical protein
MTYTHCRWCGRPNTQGDEGLSEGGCCYNCYREISRMGPEDPGYCGHCGKMLDSCTCQPKAGIDIIAAERKRQVEKEGWTADHDDKHVRGELAWAAACYAKPPLYRTAAINEGRYPPQVWPWDAGSWKPCPDNRVRELAKAGALIAAEIDRILRVGKQEF